MKIALSILGALFLAPVAFAAQLVAPGSGWAFFKGTEEASDPVAEWRMPAFVTSGWSAGAAPFYYGENVQGGSQLPDMRNRYTSLFLRSAFDLADASQIGELKLRALCDDGFIAWINGVEVLRFNVPPGEPRYNTTASSAVPEPAAWNEFFLPAPTYLRNGPNLLAVQVFNTSRGSSDLLWDAELIGGQPDVQAPRVQSVTPPPGPVDQDVALVITFDEPVSGVEPSDLLLGGVPATSVQENLDGTEYTFAFSNLVQGTAELRWEIESSIADRASVPNAFDPAAAGVLEYQVLDRRAPELSNIIPRPGLIVRALTEILLEFSEPVANLEAADLLVNGVPASSVSAVGAAAYRFQFAPPSPGSVQFTWSTGHGITDLSTSPNALIPPGWTLELDPDFTVPPLRINEIVASSVDGSGPRDEDGELHDWIEIYNAGAEPANLEGWSLSDDIDDPNRWIFPSVTIEPGEYLVVFASEKDVRTVSGSRPLHTNFKLGPDGEFLGLFNSESPRSVVSQLDFPEQRNDISYGYDPDQRLRYFQTPTPGAPNSPSNIDGIVPIPHVNVARGWFDAPFDLHISSDLPGVTLRYTTNGSPPGPASPAYSGPIRIQSNTVLRVAGFKDGMLPSKAATHTYLFPEQVLRQPANPPGFPTGQTVWSGFPADYEMDPEIVDAPEYRDLMRDALLELPVISIVCKTEDLFDAQNGIYTHPLNRGPDWERPCSVEFFSVSGDSEIQVDAGIQIQGNAAREPHKQPKHPFRLVFKGDYGPRRLDYKMFPDSPVESFDTLILRADFNVSWLHWNPTQRIRGQRTRDAWMKDSMRAMGGLASHNRYVHLFLNGLYWGIYDPSERPDGSFGEAYLGGEKEDYDVINEGQTVDGDSRDYNRMIGMSNLESPANYQAMGDLLHIRHYIDYMLLHFYTGHEDWGRNKNWYTLRPKDGRTGFLYVPWDGELILGNLNINRVANNDTPSGLHQMLRASPEYRLAFADRARKHLFDGGALTPEATAARWLKRAAEVELAIVAESARWGDYRRDVHRYDGGPFQLYTRENQWRAEQERLLTEYFPQRTLILLGQLRDAGLYPEVAAPNINAPDTPLAPGAQITLTGPAGIIYYTLDGSDPRVAFTGEVSPGAARYSEPITLAQSTRVKARVLRNGTWSALTERDFVFGEPVLPLHITELMYHPRGGDAFEFIELHHSGHIDLDVSGFSFGGINFIFPYGTVLEPGATVVLASDVSPATFQSRYPGVQVHDYFGGSLRNSGEEIELRDRNGNRVTALNYTDDAPWPSAADGDGPSLERIRLDGDADVPGNWTAGQPGGTPGRLFARDAGSVRLSEVFSFAADGSPDWIELVNVSNSEVQLDGWTLTDHSDDSLRFPTGTVIAPGQFLVILCDASDGSVLNAPFSLNRDGETVSLLDPQGTLVDAVTFGLQPVDSSVALIDGAWQLGLPTPGAPNQPAPLAPASALKINEWMANPRPGDTDWVELFNSDPDRPAALSGLSLHCGSAAIAFRVPIYVEPYHSIRITRGSDTHPGTHLPFALPASGATLELRGPHGELIDRVEYASQSEGVSLGRFPDGGDELASFPFGGTPGLHYAPNGLVLNEFFPHSASAGSWIEIHNTSNVTIDLPGHQLRDGATGVEFTFSSGALAPGEFAWISPDPLASHPGGVPVHRTGGRIELLDPAGAVLDFVEYGFLTPNLSVGRDGQDWKLLASPTPGASNSGPASLSSPDAIVLNEWLAVPLNSLDWLELYNTSASPVDLSGLQIADDPAIGASRFIFPPLSFVAGRDWLLIEGDVPEQYGPIRLGFNFNSGGEALRLYGRDGSVLDEFDFGLQSTGISMGRLEDGASEFGFITPAPTPSASNHLPPGSAIEAPRFLSIDSSSGAVEIEFWLQGGQRGRLQVAGAVDGIWETLTEIAPQAEDGSHRVTDSSPATPARFYRILGLPE